MSKSVIVDRIGSRDEKMMQQMSLEESPIFNRNIPK